MALLDPQRPSTQRHSKYAATHNVGQEAAEACEGSGGLRVQFVEKPLDGEHTFGGILQVAFSCILPGS